MDCSWVGWCGMSHEAQAAWAQAVLTAGTFGVALTHQAWTNRKQARKLEVEREERRAAEERSQRLQARAVGIAFDMALRVFLSGINAVKEEGMRHEGALEFLKHERLGMDEVLAFAGSTPSLLGAADAAQDLLASTSRLSTYVTGFDVGDDLTDDEAQTFEAMLAEVSSAATEVRKLLFPLIFPND